jgi:hypothetical protein
MINRGVYWDIRDPTDVRKVVDKLIAGSATAEITISTSVGVVADVERAISESVAPSIFKITYEGAE